MRADKRALAPLALAVVLVALAVWRAACVLAGPDVDTDAYAHHMIARAILADPRDLSVHWVWLPLFHYIQVPLVALGGTMEAVRWANVAIASAVPVVLFSYVRRTATRWPDFTAAFAAIVAAACPIAMQMSTTAQPEPAFSLIMLCAAIAWQERHERVVAGLLSAAVLLRYEAWASVAAVAATLLAEGWTSRGRAAGPNTKRAWLAVVAPCAFILAWAALRRPVDGRWFGFLGDTHQFAADATRTASPPRGAIGLARDLLYYPAWIPLRVMGPVLPLVPFGVSRTVREQGGRFALLLAACLAFVTVTWVMRATLGLDRHFVVVVPLYATFAAQGLAVAGDGALRAARRFGRTGQAAASTAAGLFAAASLGGLFVALHVWMGFWRGSIERGWPDRAAAAAFLRTLPPDATIFCDEATLEILSGLDRRRIDRHWVDDPHTWDIVADVARSRGEAYVATWARKFRGHEDAGQILFRAKPPESDPMSEILVMRVIPDAGRAAR